MERVSVAKRQDWERRVSAHGYSYINSCLPYWGEGTAYRLTKDQISELWETTQELNRLCLSAVDYVVTHNLMDRFGIPAAFQESVARSWRADDVSLCGRFDLVYDGKTPPKMLEYNGMTAATLPETITLQSEWLDDMKRSGALPAQSAQYNSLENGLTKAWQRVARQVSSNDPVVFACAYMKDGDIITRQEDACQLWLMRDIARKAGVRTHTMDLLDIGWDGASFTTKEGKPIRSLYMFYPWDVAMEDDFGLHFNETKINVIEPQWKSLLSNKALLSVLWDLYPDHPNLLPAFMDEGRIKGACVRKPVNGFGGADVTLLADGRTRTGAGAGFVYQAYAPLPDFNGFHPVVSSWVASERADFTLGEKAFKGRACAMSIREDRALVTNADSRFVPHYFIG